MIVEQHGSRSAWLAARGKGVGGSDVAAILGLSPWNAPLSLWMSKVGMLPPTDLVTDAMVWGNKVEAAIIADVAEQAQVDAQPTPLTIIRHEDEPDLFCSPDALIYMGGWKDPVAGLEVKNVYGGKAPEWSDGAPPYVACQAQHSMYVTGLPCWLVGACIGGRRPVWCWVNRDLDWWETNGPRITDFLRRVREEDPPPPTAHDADKEALGEMYPAEIEGKVVALPSEAIDWTSELAEIGATRKAIEKRENELKNLIRAAIGDAEEGLIPGGLGRWKWSTVDVAAHEVKAARYRKLLQLKGER